MLRSFQISKEQAHGRLAGDLATLKDGRGILLLMVLQKLKEMNYETHDSLDQFCGLCM